MPTCILCYLKDLYKKYKDAHPNEVDNDGVDDNKVVEPDVKVKKIL